MIHLKSNIVYIYKEKEEKIILIDSMEDSNLVFVIQSKNYHAHLNTFLASNMTAESFALLLSPEAMLELEKILKELKESGFIVNQNENSFSRPISHNTGTIINGEDFILSTDLLMQAVYAPTYSEGEACSPLGSTYCETNTGNANFSRELWQCISGPPNNWAAMGQSC